MKLNEGTQRRIGSARNAAPGNALYPGGAIISATREVKRKRTDKVSAARSTAGNGACVTNTPSSGAGLIEYGIRHFRRETGPGWGVRPQNVRNYVQKGW